MKKYTALLLLIFVLLSCNSNTELKGVDSILAFYGGKILYSKGINTSTDKNEIQGRYYEIKLSDSRIFNYFKVPDLAASNSAYLLYKEFTNAEKESYDFIRVIIEDVNKTYKYEFPIEKIDLVEKSMQKMDSFFLYIKNKNYQAIADLCNPMVKDISVKTVADIFTQVDNEYGAAKEFSFQGFSFSELDNKEKSISLLRLSGIIVREKESTDFSISIDPKAKDKYIYGFRFAK